jgi:Arc/MetJ family transcription regulator
MEKYTMHRTNIELEESLVKTGLKVTGLKTRKALINHALRELVRRKEQRKILSLKGTVQWEGDLSHLRGMRGV